jgi:hypothetical protein
MLYPDPNIADSWDQKWRKANNYYCDDTVWENKDTLIKKPPSIIQAKEGETVKCINKNFKNVFRWTNGRLMLYSDDTAKSWNADLTDFKYYVCDDTVWEKQGIMELKKKMNATEIKSGLEITGSIINQGNYPPSISGTILKCAGNASDYFMMIKDTLRKFPNVNIASSWDNNYFNSKSYDCSKKINDTTMMEELSNGTPSANTTIRCAKDYINNDVKYYSVYVEDNNTILSPVDSLPINTTAKIYNCDNYQPANIYYSDKLLNPAKATKDYTKYDTSHACDGVDVLYNGVHYCFPYKLDENGVPVLYDVRDIFNGQDATIDTGKYIATGIVITEKGISDSFNIKGITVIPNCIIQAFQVYTMDNKDKAMFSIL